MLRAHAMAWHAYDREFRRTQGGQVGRAEVSVFTSIPSFKYVPFSDIYKISELKCCAVSQVSLALHMDWVEPAFSFSREDVEPAKRVLDFRVGWFAEPIFGSGDYPLGMRSWLRQLNSLEYKRFHSYFIHEYRIQPMSSISCSPLPELCLQPTTSSL